MSNWPIVYPWIGWDWLGYIPTIYIFFRGFNLDLVGFRRLRSGLGKILFLGIVLGTRERYICSYQSAVKYNSISDLSQTHATARQSLVPTLCADRPQ